MSVPEPQATPEQEAQVRRLLARARHDEPVPDAVATRLDEVLAGLVAEGRRGAPPPPPPPGNVVDLAARRRRRATGLLVAAAAVVAVGVGLGQVVGGTDEEGDDGDSSSAGGAADTGDLRREGGAAPGSGEQEAPDAPAPTPSKPSLAQPIPEPIELDQDDFQQVARRFQDVGGLRSAPAERVEAEDLTPDTAFVCPAAAYGEGDLIAVRYEDAPAVLAYRPPTGQTQTVEVLQCGTADVLLTSTLPVD